MELVFGALNLLGLGGLAAFVYWTYRGLQDRIKNLTQLAQEQKETLEAVRTRATELDQLRKDYRQGLEDFQHLGDRLKDRREELVKEYEAALQKKDEQLAKAKELEIKGLELKEQSLQLIPELQDRLASTVDQLQKQVQILASAREKPSTRLWSTDNGIPLAQVYVLADLLREGRRRYGDTTVGWSGEDIGPDGNAAKRQHPIVSIDPTTKAVDKIDPTS